MLTTTPTRYSATIWQRVAAAAAPGRRPSPATTTEVPSDERGPAKRNRGYQRPPTRSLAEVKGIVGYLAGKIS